MSDCTARYHGTAAAYCRVGCRCPDARADHYRYRKLGRLGLRPPAYVDSTGSRRRLQALMRIGWPLRSLMAMIGWSPSSCPPFMSTGSRIHRRTAEQISNLYDRLAHIPGRSKTTRSRAERKGFPAPLDWLDVDIDDPTAAPDLDPGDEVLIDEVVIDRLMSGHPTESTRSDRIEATRRMTDAGQSISQIAAKLDTAERNVIRYRKALRVRLASPTDDALEATA